MTALSPSFLSPLNVQVLLLALCINGLIALSQMIIIAIGQMNLSVGAIGGLAAIAFAGLMQIWGLPAPLAALLALAIGILGGVLNGLFIAWTGLSAFVITLASLSIFKGINLGITRAQPFYGVPESVKAFGNTNVLGPLPWLLIPCGIVFVATWYLLNRLSLGRQILAVGGNEHAAALSGIPVGRTIIAAHAISGGLAALAGIALVARLQIGQPTIGDDWLILSFAAPVIGGAVLSGGHVSVPATLLGSPSSPSSPRRWSCSTSTRSWSRSCSAASSSGRSASTAGARSGSPARRRGAEHGRGGRGFRGTRGFEDLPGRKGARRRLHHPAAGLDPGAARRERGGKSTLIKIITGVYRPDGGELRFDGAPIRFTGARDAMAAGIGFVPQERNLIPRFSIGENIALESNSARAFKPIDYARINADARRWLDLLDLDLDPAMRFRGSPSPRCS